MNIIVRELKLFTRSGGWLMAILMALVTVFTIGLAVSGEMHSIPIGISGDKSYSSVFIDKFNTEEFNPIIIDSANVNSLLTQGTIRSAITCTQISPDEYEVIIYIDVTDQVLKEQMKHLITSYIYEVLNPEQIAFIVTVHEEFSGKTFFSYFGPGVIGLAILTGGLFGASETVLREKDSKTLENVILSGFGATRFITEKVISFMISMSVISILCIILVFILGTGIPSIGGLIALILVVILGELIFVSLGVALSTFCPNEEVSGEMLAMIMLPFMFISGAFFTIYQMNPLIIPVAKLNPLTVLIDALRAILLKGAFINDLIIPLIYLATIGLLIFISAVLLMYRIIKNIQN